MPKVNLTATQRQDRAFLAALQYGLAMLGENHTDAARIFPGSVSTYYNRLKKPETFNLNEIRVFGKHHYINDRQLCEACGIEYHGGTPK